MEFLKLSIDNYRVFRGSYTFDLAVKPSKPIVLFGGRNGSGKTSLFEAIQLCIYGRLYFPRTINRKKYFEEILERFSKSNDQAINSKEMRLELIFRYAKQGNIDIYKIIRFWELKGEEKIKEDFWIFKNDQEQLNSDENLWQSFIKEIMPPELPELFFFNGEKFNQLLYPEEGSPYLIHILRKLTGINLVMKLKDDVGYLLEEYIIEESSDEVKEGIEKIKNEINIVEEHIEDLQQDYASLRVKIDLNSKRRTELEQIVNGLGEDGLEIKKILEQKRTSLVSEKKGLNEDLLHLCSQLLPFLAVRKLSLKLSKRIEVEQKRKHLIPASSLVKALVQHLRDGEQSQELWETINLEEELKTTIITRLTEFLTQKIEDEVIGKTQVIAFDLSSSDYSKLVYQISEVNENLKNEALSMIQTIRELQAKIDQLEFNIIREEDNYSSKLSSNEELGTLVLERNNLNQEAERINKQIDTQKKIKEELHRQYESLISEYKKTEHLERINKYINSVESVLSDYSEDLFSRKLEELSDLVLECFRELSPNGEGLRKVVIDPITERISFQGSEGNDIFYKNPSAGEDHILALSVVWALMKMLKWPMPLIIDTPLSRLDYTHRSRIVKSLFPSISSQIIIFSTDTEIDCDFFKELSPLLSQSYLLRKEKEKQDITVSSEYFFQGLEVSQ